MGQLTQMAPTGRRIAIRGRLLRGFVLSFGLVLAAGATADETESLVRQALAAEAQFDSARALELLLRLKSARPDDAFVHQKIARQYSDLEFETSDETEKRRLCTLALDHARRAVALQPRDAVNVLSLAICYGKLATLSDTRTKLHYSRLVKEHAETALALDPGYDYAYHVLGRWHYEVASVGGAARLVAKLIYGGLPPASIAEAVRLLQQAVTLAPQLPSHRVELGFALLADGQKNAARTAFEAALQLPQREKHDREAWARARAALAKL